MSSEVVQTEQRKANLEAITRLGFAAYPNKFDTTHAVTQLVDAHTSTPAADARGGARRHRHRRPRRRHPQLRQGQLPGVVRRPLAHPGLRAAGRLERARLPVVEAARPRRSDRRRRAPVPHQDQRVVDLGVALEFLAKCFLPLPEKWHGLQDVEIRYRQRYLDLIVNPEVRRVFEIRTATVTAIRDFLEGPRIPRGRDADDAADCRRRAGAAVRDASQRARHEAVPAHRARAVPEAADRRRRRAGVRDQPQLPQRRHLDAAQSRVHDARVLLGLRRLPAADVVHRGAVVDGRDAGDRHDRVPVRRAHHQHGRAVPPAVAASRRGGGGRRAARHHGHGRGAAVARFGHAAGAAGSASRFRRAPAPARSPARSSRRSGKST